MGGLGRGFESDGAPLRRSIRAARVRTTRLIPPKHYTANFAGFLERPSATLSAIAAVTSPDAARSATLRKRGRSTIGWR